MRVNQHAQHTKGFVVFDKTHSAHVGGEVVDKIDIGDGALATFLFLKIELQIFRFRKHLEPFLEWFHIDYANLFALAKQVGREMAANEAASPADHDFFRFHFATLAPERPRTLLGKRVASTGSKLHALFDGRRRRPKKPIAQEIINEHRIIPEITRAKPTRLGQESKQ